MYPEDEKTKELREKLRDYYGTAMVSGFPMAAIDLAKVDEMEEDEIRETADRLGIGG